MFLPSQKRSLLRNKPRRDGGDGGGGDDERARAGGGGVGGGQREEDRGGAGANLGRAVARPGPDPRLRQGPADGGRDGVVISSTLLYCTP